jgi:5-hydroxyisourate hydrolase
MARISTHVLDVELGRPAAGVPVELWRDGALLASARTNFDGRTDRPLLSAEQLDPGVYELIFRTGEYLKSREASPFYDDIAIRFAVSDGAGNYHVPLLLAGHGYSTYRGS